MKINDIEKAQGHWLLAKMGKRVLRPGGTEFNEFILPQADSSDWTIVHHSIKLSDIYLNHDNIVLKTYIWNKSRKNFVIKDFEIKLRKGNPIIYGLYEKI